MAGDEERNFRSVYYDKIGCKIADEKAIDKILEEKPININKLVQYVNKFGVTQCRRLVVWKTLLGISTQSEEDDDYISSVHTKVCNLLESGLQMMSVINGKTKDHAKLLLMYILEVKELSSDVEKQLSTQDNLSFSAIAMIFVNLGFPFVDTYWLMRTFFHKIEEQKQLIMKMAQKFTVEDSQLEKHLEETGAKDVLPISLWFYRCFAGILHDSCLAKIWDRLIAGSFKSLPLIAKFVLLELKDSLLSMTSATEIRRVLLEPISQGSSEKIVNQVLSPR